MAYAIVTRQESPRWGSCLVFIAAMVLSLGLSALLLALQGKPPIAGLMLLFKGAFGAGYAIEDGLRKAMPLFLCALGVSVAFRMQIWNIGAEGQYALGAIGAAGAALAWPTGPAWALLPLMLLSGAASGALWGLIPGVLRVRLGLSEIIVSLMLNYIGIQFLDYLVYGPWKDPVSFGFPYTPEFGPGAIIPAIPGTRVHMGVVLCALAAVAFGLLFSRTRLGFEIKVSGLSPATARYARMDYPKLVMLVMAMSGALSGVAGFMESSAAVGRLQPGVMAGYGYTAIVVAWLAKLRPASIALASVLLAALRVGVDNLQLELAVPAAFGQIIEGLVLLSVLAGQFFTRYRIIRRPETTVLQN